MPTHPPYLEVAEVKLHRFEELSQLRVRPLELLVAACVGRRQQVLPAVVHGQHRRHVGLDVPKQEKREREWGGQNSCQARSLTACATQGVTLLFDGEEGVLCVHSPVEKRRKSVALGQHTRPCTSVERLRVELGGRPGAEVTTTAKQKKTGL